MASSELEQKHPIPRKLWQHPDPKSTRMWKFMQKVNKKHGLDLKTFHEMHEWSVGDRRLQFWESLWEEAGLIYEGQYTEIVDESVPMDALPHWYRGTRLNFAENLLYTAPRPGKPTPPTQVSTLHKEDSKIAITEIREGCSSTRHYTYGELRRRVALLANAFRAKGVKKGDRVGLVASSSFDTLVCFLAITSLGGVFSSSSTDMGSKGVLERLVQIRPKYVFVDDWAVYNGKTIDLRPKTKEIVQGLEREKITEFEGIVVQPRFDEAADVSGYPRTVTLEQFLGHAKGNAKLTFERVEFRDPFLIVYSSGTTGIPKCIVHSVGGVLLVSIKEGGLHRGCGPDTVLLQFTTTGWIMFLISIMAPLYGGRSILYDGSPFQPDLQTYLKIMGEHKVTDLGTSPRYLQTLASANLIPKRITDLSNLRTVTCTGMVLSDALFEWFYDQGFPPAAHLANISGGTDLAGAFGMDNPLEPVYLSGTQGPSLGLSVEVYDSLIPEGEPGKAVPDGEPGELVATKSFPNQPIYFYSDPDNTKYHSAYYTRFPHVWTHGDFIVRHPLTKNLLFLGRSDGVLNPSGVRFGSADIYSVLEEHFSSSIEDALCVGQRRPQDDDERVLLFLKMRAGKTLSAELITQVKQRIGVERSKRHVPRWVFETPEIPTTVNGKKVELPVKQIVSGRVVKASGTLANPRSLEFYYRFARDENLVDGTERVRSKL